MVLQFKDIDFNKIIATDLWVINNKEQNQFGKNLLSYFFLMRCFLRLIYRSFFSYPNIKTNEQKNFQIFYIRTNTRPDLANHSNFYENINGTTVCILSERKRKIDIFNFFKIIFFLFKKFRFWYFGLKKNNLSLFSIKGFYIFLIFLESLSDLIKIIPIFKKHKKLVCFQETLPTENFLCQYANYLNINTFSLQHALGVYSIEGLYESRFPICSYINLVSKNIMCWGTQNKKIYRSHSLSKIHVIGKPFLPNLSSNIDGVTFIFENKEFKETNNYMLSLSEKFKNKNIQTSRWFKPSHSLLSSGIIRDGPLRKIIIGCNSTLVIELGYLGFKVFVTKDSNLCKLLPDELIIKDVNFFLDKEKILSNYPFEIWKDFIECSGNESLSRYKEILERQI